MIDEGEVLARATLMRAADVGDRLMGRLVQLCGPQGAVDAIRTGTLPEDAFDGLPSGALSGGGLPGGGAAGMPRGTASGSAIDGSHGAAEGLLRADASSGAIDGLHGSVLAGGAAGRLPGGDASSGAIGGLHGGVLAGGGAGRLPGGDALSGAADGMHGGVLPGAQGAPDTRVRLDKRMATWRARLEAADPAADLAAGERVGARLVVPGMLEWPTQLDELGPGRPLGLWLHGTADLRYSCLRSVAVVGARAATAYGAHIAAEFGAGLSEAGWSVISGGAYGIDGAAHRGALAGGSPTVVVLACGTDVCYPTGHDSLFSAVRDQGVVVSECPPGVHPTRARFLIRNRLIAALSRGTVVVEAALRSGALNTASHAIALNRHLAAVPGPITSEMSAGCHRLLRERTAVCVTSPEEMIELVGRIGADLAPQARGPAIPRDALTEPTRRVLDAVPSRGAAGPATIAVAAGVDLGTALSCLGGLAAAGYIERTAHGWRLRRTPAPRPQPAPDPALTNHPALTDPLPPLTPPLPEDPTPWPPH